MRLLKHAGRPGRPRRLMAEARSAGNWRISLAPGTELPEGLVGFLGGRGIQQAGIRLLGGSFDCLHLRAGRASDRGRPLAAPGESRRLQGPLLLVGGEGVLGCGPDGRPLLHCQVMAVDGEGRLQGGNLPARGSRVGAGGLVVLVSALAGAGFITVEDSETGVSLFEPVPEPA